MSALVEEIDFEAYHTSEAVSRAERPSDYVERRPLLDRPSDPHPLLTMLMHEALCRIMLTSDGAVMALRERVSGGYADTRQPSSNLASLIDGLWLRYARCRTHRARLLIIRDAQRTALRLRYAPDRSKVRGTPAWREAIAQDSRSCRVLGVVYGVSYRTIARIKKDSRCASL